VDAVVKAFEDAGSVCGAARLLNTRNVKTRMGKPWSTTTVRATLIRMNAMPTITRPGAKARAPYMLYGLLRCHCGHVLTGSRFTNGTDTEYTSYKCHYSRVLADHGRGAVPEKHIMPWIIDEAARLTVPESVIVEQERQAERDRIERRKSDLSFMLEKGGMNRETYLQRLEAIKTDEAALDAKEAVETLLAVPEHIDWLNWSAEDINRVLSTRWERVELDENMKPIRAVWRLPEWRDAAPMGSARMDEMAAGQRAAVLAKIKAGRRVLPQRAPKV
jgi:hypothetical protein